MSLFPKTPKLLCIPLLLLSSAVHAEVTVYPRGGEKDHSHVYVPGEVFAESAEELVLRPGPHLLIDDYWIEDSEGLRRVVGSPKRDAATKNPIVTADAGDKCVGPYVRVLPAEEGRPFRLYYNGFSDGKIGLFGLKTSPDAQSWNEPGEQMKVPGPMKWGCSVVDSGADCSDPSTRYKLAWYAWSPVAPKKPGGLMIATSADGLKWKSLNRTPLFRHNHDINSLYFDPHRERYVYTYSTHQESPDWEETRRVTMQTVSTDLREWSEPWFVLRPRPDKEHDQTQFYAMDGFLSRGELLVGMVKVLRDDLKATDTPSDAYGIGYTTLAWSRDGKNWVRDLEPFFEPDPTAGSWDHAHAWIDEQVPQGEEVLLYYGGYARGHKMGRTTDRQIGVVSMKQDRYVARSCEGGSGWLRTPLVMLESSGLAVNADVRGSLRAKLLDEEGQVIEGFDLADFKAIKGDAIDHSLQWSGNLSKLRGKQVQLEIHLDDADLYALQGLK